MLYINNPQAAKAILEGRRHDDGQFMASDPDLSPADEAAQPTPERQVLLPRLSALFSTN